MAQVINLNRRTLVNELSKFVCEMCEGEPAFQDSEFYLLFEKLIAEMYKNNI